MKKLLFFVFVFLILNSTFSIASPVQLPATGQTTSYVAGDDGALQKGEVWQTTRFVDNGDGSMKDTLTNLIWTKDGNAPGPAACNPATTKTWQGALDYVACLNSNSFLGKSDWRLPNRKELMSLVNRGQANPATWLNSQGFSGVQGSGYWSSSTYADGTNYAWYVGMGSGYMLYNNKYYNYYVWPVRGGQWSLDSLAIYGSFNLGRVNVGQTGVNKVVKLSNTGATSQAVTTIGITGPNANQFSITPGGSTPCPSLSPTLAAGQKCTLSLSFAPDIVGEKSANLTISANGKSVDIPLSGTGISKITGTLYDLSNGNRLVGATISVAGGANTQSDQSGIFSFLLYANGTVTISKNGYGEATINVTIPDTTGANLNIGLTPTGTLNFTTTSGTLPAAIAGVSYTKQLNITGGNGPFTFNLAGGTLPPGLSIDASLGTISGAPFKTGNFLFAIGVTDNKGVYAEREFSIDVSMPLVITDSAVFPRLTLNSLFSFNINPTGGTPPYAVTLDSGTIPLAPTNHHYEYHPEKVRFSDANSICSSRKGGHLVSITSSAEQNSSEVASYAFDVNNGSSGDYVWIGLARGVGAAGWIWTNKEPTTYEKWAVLEPRTGSVNNCATQGNSFGIFWFAKNCTESHAFLCEYEEISFPTNDQFKGLVTPQGTSNFTIKVTDAKGRVVTKQFTMYVDAPFSITTPQLNDGITGAPYSKSLTATGGYGTYSWSVFSGTLPSGMTLDGTTGVISGTPAEAGIKTLMFAATDENGRVAYRTYNLTITSPLQITTTALPQGHLGDPYSEQIQILEGIAPYTFTISGQLPGGLTLNSATGFISGTPSASGVTNMQLTVTDSSYPAPQTQTQNLSIRVSSFITILTTSILPTGRKNVTITPTNLTANGGTSPYTWSIVSGKLPQGITLDPSTGIISGTPLEIGDFSATIRATDSALPSATVTKQFFMHISDTLQLQTATMSSGVTDKPYYQTLQAVNGLPPYTWGISVGQLPAGLSLDSKSGMITGVPLSSGDNMFTVVVTDSDNPARTSEHSYNINVVEMDRIITTNLPPAIQNASYTTTLISNGGVPPLTWTVLNGSGSLPAGIILDTKTGIISGTPSACGSFTFTVTLTDSATVPNIFNRTFVINVACMNGACGWSSGKGLLVAPTSNLCFSGVSTPVTGTGPWNWICQGIDSGTSENCVATLQVSGNCGLANGSNLISAPSTNLCSSGATSNVTGTGPWSWTCFGSNGGSDATCLANLKVNGVCGSSNGGTFTIVPTINLCSSGITSNLSGSGPWNWKCTGNNGGTNADCSANYLPGFVLSVTILGSGNGTVTSNPAGIACTNATCSYSYPSASSVSLLQTQNATSTFAGWSGACTTTPCIVTMNANKAVTATFTDADRARVVGGKGFSSLAAAYLEAAKSASATIKTLDTTLNENLTMDKPVAIMLTGGWNATFGSKSGMPTLLNGGLMIGSGSLTVDELTIK